MSNFVKRKHTFHSKFHFHPKCKKEGITHLAFADDLMLFCRGDVGSVEVLKDCLEIFGRTSGLNASVPKSNLFLAGVHGAKALAIENALQFRKGSFPFRYLASCCF